MFCVMFGCLEEDFYKTLKIARTFRVNNMSQMSSSFYFAFSIPDDVIKRRLLYEGDGGSDDKRINSLMKNFIRWNNATESPEEK